jgi:FkbM family methyltransferase
MGKMKRDEYLQSLDKSILDFLPGGVISLNGIKALPRRHTNDFYILFTPREKMLNPHLTMNDDEVFVDVGANVVSYSLMIARKYGNRGVTVIAIEAHPENYSALCKNIELNGFTCIKAINMAVSDHEGSVTMYEYLDFGRHSRYETFSIDNNAGYVKSAGNLQVPSNTLDNILGDFGRIDLVKMDIEGAEVLALKGARNTLRRLRKIIVEIHNFNFQKVMQILESYDFKLEVIDVKWGEYKIHGFIVGSKC